MDQSSQPLMLFQVTCDNSPIELSMSRFSFSGSHCCL
jgi:hypothetical protein